MGLSVFEAITSLGQRADTPNMRMFVRSLTQGEKLGVSIASTMRNLAVEMRKRRRAVAEEKAQKMPIKLLFPLVFLIFPAIMIVLLGAGHDPHLRSALERHGHADAPPRRRTDRLRALRRRRPRTPAFPWAARKTPPQSRPGHGAPPRVRDPHALHALPDRRRLPGLRSGRRRASSATSAPWRTASFRGAREVVELAAGECDRRGLEVGDRVAWASQKCRRRPCRSDELGMGRRLPSPGHASSSRAETPASSSSRAFSWKGGISRWRS